MKKLFILMLFCALSITINAQQTDAGTPAEASENKPISVNLGLTFASPMGDFADFASTGLGGDVTFEYPLSQSFIGMASLGYISFGSEDIDLGGFGKFEYGYSAVPIYAGGKVFLSDKRDFYGMFQLGVHIFSLNTQFTNPVTRVTDEETSTNVRFGLGFGGGYKYAVSENFALDANAKYWYGADNTSYIAIRGGIVFTF